MPDIPYITELDKARILPSSFENCLSDRPICLDSIRNTFAFRCELHSEPDGKVSILEHDALMDLNTRIYEITKLSLKNEVIINDYPIVTDKYHCPVDIPFVKFLAMLPSQRAEALVSLNCREAPDDFFLVHPSFHESNTNTTNNDNVGDENEDGNTDEDDTNWTDDDSNWSGSDFEGVIIEWVVQSIQLVNYVGPMGALSEKLTRIDRILDMPRNLGSLEGWFDTVKQLGDMENKSGNQ